MQSIAKFSTIANIRDIVADINTWFILGLDDDIITKINNILDGSDIVYEGIGGIIEIDKDENYTDLTNIITHDELQKYISDVNILINSFCSDYGVTDEIKNVLHKISNVHAFAVKIIITSIRAEFIKTTNYERIADAYGDRLKEATRYTHLLEFFELL